MLRYACYVLFLFFFSSTFAETQEHRTLNSVHQAKTYKKQKKTRQKRKPQPAPQETPYQENILFQGSIPSQENLPEPYHSVQLLPFDPHGWYGNAQPIQSLFTNNKNISIAIEVGCWLGASTRHIASLLPPNGKLFAIDHWKGSVEHQPGQVAYYPALPYLYEQFLSNVIYAGLTDKIIPMRMDSLEAARQLKASGIVPDLIYIDASHDTQAVLADLNAWFPFVKGHGILCGDDWSWASVRLAVETFANEQHLTISAANNFWCLVEKK